MSSALTIEWWKLRRSRVVSVATFLLAGFIPAMGLGIFSVANSDTTGPLAAKTAGLLIGEGWEAYLGAIAQISAAGFFVGAGVVAAWVFGREHADRTFSSLFALTVSRRTIALAKFIVLTGWVVILTAAIGVVAVIIGAIADVGPIDSAILEPLGRLLAVVLIAGLLSLSGGYIASVGRGYLPAVGFLAITVAVSQVAVLFGTGGWLPFVVPGLIAIAGSEAAPDLSAIQFALVPVVIAFIVWLTVVWWQKAEVA